MPKADGKTIVQRFFANLQIDPVTGCWNWQAGKSSCGYGYIWTGPNRRGDTRAAFYVGWELLIGSVPDGKELHHKCENRACVNPFHLVPCTRKEHQNQHANNPVTVNRHKEACKRGHKFTEANTRINKNGGRVCRTCALLRMRNQRKRGGLSRATQ